MADVVAELSQLARESPHLNQRSGVSVRLTIANYETLVANATRRALRNGEAEAVPRVSDLQALVSLDPRQGRGRVARGGSRGGPPRPSWSTPPCSSSSAAGSSSTTPPPWSGPSPARRWSTPGTTCRPSAYADHPGPAAGALRPGGRPDRWIRGPGPGGQCAGVPAGRAAPHQAPQQGGGRGPCPLPGSRMTWRFDYRRWDGTQDDAGRRHRRRPLAADRRPAGQRRPARGAPADAQPGLASTRRHRGPGLARPSRPAPAGAGGAARPR